MVIYNQTDKVQDVSINLQLISTSSFELDTDNFPKTINHRISGGETEMYQNTIWYNSSQKKGEGKPASLDWSIGCSDFYN